MTKIFSLFIILCYLMPAQAVDSKINQITVTGSVEIKQRADAAEFTFTVTRLGAQLREAVESATNAAIKIREKLNLIGVKSNAISTSDFISGENPGEKAFLSSSKDYRAKIITSVKLDSLPLLPAIIICLSSENVENVSDIIYLLKDPASVKSRARIEAANKARQKAEEILAPLGAKLGYPLIVEEISPNQFSPRYLQLQSGNTFNSTAYNPQSTFDPDSESGSGFFSQTVAITCMLRVTFEIK